MSGYSVVDLRKDDGGYSGGFKKILSAVSNWEKKRDQVEHSVLQGMIQAISEVPELTWFDKVCGVETKKAKLCKVMDMDTVQDSLMVGGYITYKESCSVDSHLTFHTDRHLYDKITALIRNGEQFILGDDLCKFINKYSSYGPKGE